MAPLQTFDGLWLHALAASWLCTLCAAAWWMGLMREVQPPVKGIAACERSPRMPSCELRHAWSEPLNPSMLPAVQAWPALVP